MPQGQVDIVEVVSLLGRAGPADLEMLEVVSIIEERIEPFPGIGGIRILVNETGYCVDVICQLGRARKP